MDKRLRRKITTFFLAVVWLAVVAASVIIVVTRREEYGLFTYIAPGMAVFMLIIFVLTFLPKKTQDTPIAKKLGELCTGALLLIVIAVLGIAIYHMRGSILGMAALILFFTTFVRIFIDWVKHCTNPKPKRRRRKKKTATPATPAAPENDTAGDAEVEGEDNGEKPANE